MKLTILNTRLLVRTHSKQSLPNFDCRICDSLYTPCTFNSSTFIEQIKMINHFINNTRDGDRFCSAYIIDQTKRKRLL